MFLSLIIAASLLKYKLTLHFIIFVDWEGGSGDVLGLNFVCTLDLIKDVVLIPILFTGVQMVKSEKKKEKKSKKGKKEKSKECKVDGKTYESDKHSPTKLIKEKFMTLRHSAKKLHSKGSELEV